MKAGQKVLGKHYFGTLVTFAAAVSAVGIILSGCASSLPQNEESSAIAAVSEDSEIDITSEYSMATERAEYYYKTLILSKACARYRLLNFDGFSEEATDYALRHINANWKENALRRAKYLKDEYSMSNTDIFYILIDDEGENFTWDEADYAIQNLT